MKAAVVFLQQENPQTQQGVTSEFKTEEIYCNQRKKTKKADAEQVPTNLFSVGI